MSSFFGSCSPTRQWRCQTCLPCRHRGSTWAASRRRSPLKGCACSSPHRRVIEVGISWTPRGIWNVALIARQSRSPPPGARMIPKRASRRFAPADSGQAATDAGEGSGPPTAHILAAFHQEGLLPKTLVSQLLLGAHPWARRSTPLWLPGLLVHNLRRSARPPDGAGRGATVDGDEAHRAPDRECYKHYAIVSDADLQDAARRSDTLTVTLDGRGGNGVAEVRDRIGQSR